MDETDETAPPSNQETKHLFFSTDKEGELKVKQEVGEQLSNYLLKGAGYLVTTVLGGLVVVVWGIYGDLSEVKGKISTPEKYLETISERLTNLEKENKELQSKNYELEIARIRLELERDNNTGNGN